MMNTTGETAAIRSKSPAPRQGWKPLRDAIVAFAVFPVIALTAGSGPIHAGPSVTSHLSLPAAAVKAVDDNAPAPVVQIATVAANDEADAAYRRTSFGAAWILLGASFALVVALNMAMARHLRQAYVPRRRRSSEL